MTREEAATILYKEWQRFLEDNLDYAGISDAYKMAINTLKQEPCEDAISRADVKKYLSAPDANGDRVIYESDLDLLPSVTPQPRWIPVSEGSPKEEGLYLVTVKNEHDRRYSKTCWFHGDGNWFARQDVIAWMPSPASYEPKESEEKE